VENLRSAVPIDPHNLIQAEMVHDVYETQAGGSIAGGCF
jgi:hypothetical protein